MACSVSALRAQHVSVHSNNSFQIRDTLLWTSNTACYFAEDNENKNTRILNVLLFNPQCESCLLKFACFSWVFLVLKETQTKR